MAHYVIITPAHNEEAFIERTIESMIRQTVRPRKWVIVNDASTDGTRELVSGHLSQHPFMELVSAERPPGRHFGNKVKSFNLGLAKVQGVDYQFIGNLDADVSFEPNYFENILAEFERDSKLGLAGGMIHTNIEGSYVSQRVALDSVAGAVQLFRRKCFERIGGYLALPNGGVDAAAEIACRMYGWKVRTFPENKVLEHRRTGSATTRPLASRMKEGFRFHSLGYSPLFFLIRCVYRLGEQPRILGSGAALFSYFVSAIRGNPITLPPQMVRYLRMEQRRKLKRMLRLPSGLLERRDSAPSDLVKMI
jgi:glycosyltransferase involved in cell wall biosynthesis